MTNARVSIAPPLRRSATAGIALAALALLLVAACSSQPQTRFHTLLPPPAQAATAAVATIAATGSLAWEVEPVVIPARVDQPQWVVRGVDGSLAVLEQERWIAPLAAEIRAAVTETLTRTLGAPAPAAAAGAETRGRWQVRIEVQRFDMAIGKEVRLAATWSLRYESEGGGALLSCQGDFAQPVASMGYTALATAQQQSVGKLAETIARALAAMSADRVGGCGR